ncbi:MAG TPA: hypothetical protein VH796_07675 [Nitrososphaeraceae archaeon]|jgi:hypothetical protein
MSDSNMDTLYHWAFDYPSLDSLPTELESDRVKLIEIVDMIESCTGKEFEDDKQAFRVINGRDPTDEELPQIHAPFIAYDPLRKQILLDCIKRCLEKNTEIDEKVRLNLSVRLWAGCLDAANKLAIKTPSGPITGEMRSTVFTERIDALAHKDSIYRKGVEIACMWRPSPIISFDGVPKSSPARKYEQEWITREGTRQMKFCNG